MFTPNRNSRTDQNLQIILNLKKILPLFKYSLYMLSCTYANLCAKMCIITVL